MSNRPEHLRYKEKGVGGWENPVREGGLEGVDGGVSCASCRERVSTGRHPGRPACGRFLECAPGGAGVVRVAPPRDNYGG